MGKIHLNKLNASLIFKKEISVFKKKVKTHNTYCGFPFAEKEGFEPPDLLQSTVFKTAAFDHSAISPVVLYYKV